jgi:3-oxoacyl-[acyl-carrier-protein] synthase II
MREVVITGTGILSPLGHGVPANRQALIAGRNGVRRIQNFESAGFPIQSAGEVEMESLARDNARPGAMAELALAEALASAGLPAPGETEPNSQWAASFAIGKPTVDLELLIGQRARWQEEPTAAGVYRLLPELVESRDVWDPAALAARLARRAGAGGRVFSCYTACASGNDALGLGKRLIERGEADVVIAGGTDSQVHPLSMLEFDLLSALSREEPELASRPFDRNRTGFVIGEGAAVVVLEAREHAARRGAPVRARLAGYGLSLDGYGLTKCHPEGKGAAQAMQAALDDARLSTAEIGYINAHGTATVLNDAAETAAVRRVWGEAAKSVPISSTKSLTGHLLTAASAVEAVFSLLALEGNFLPVNRNYETPDPDCDLDIIQGETRFAPLRAVMSNGFGFGGQNASLILTRA